MALRPGSWVARLVRGVETLVIVVLLVLLGVVLLGATAQLVVMVATDTARLWGTLHSIDELAELRPVFSGFLLILIGLELMKTISMYLAEHVVQVEVVLTVAMIAVARHAIEIDYGNAGIGELAGTAALVLALAAGYYLYRRSGPTDDPLAEDGSASRAGDERAKVNASSQVVSGG
jgi:uncharacterized membrane protein (DUF373 family)